MDFKDLRLFEEISLGHFGKVIKIKEETSDVYYAGKISPQAIDDTSSIINDIQKDIDKISKINHPSINKILGFYVKDIENEKRSIILTEFKKNGSLYDIIHSDEQASTIELDSTQRQIIIYGIASAMYYLHMSNLYHGHLTLSNILLDDNLHPIITDFLYPKYFKPDNQEDNDSNYKADIYSYGKIISEIITSGQDEMPEPYALLINACTSQNPSDRPTSPEIIDNLLNKALVINSDVDVQAYVDYIHSSEENIGDNDEDEDDVEDNAEVEDEEVKYYQELLRKAENGDAESNQELGIIHYNAEKDENDYKKEAAEYFKVAADKGLAYSMHMYAVMLQNGIGIEVDKEESVEYYKKAIEKGFAKSMENYGFMLYKGEGIEENKELSFKYFKQAAEEGQVDSIYQTALMLERGEGVEKNEQESIKYYKKAADEGNVKSMYKYALMLSKEDVIDKSKLKKYIKKAINEDDKNAMYFYACLLYRGQIFTMKRTRAARYFKMSADLGKVYSMFNYALMEYYSNGIVGDKKVAAKYFKMAADKGQVDSMHMYAMMLQNGIGIEVDKKESVEYYKKAIEKGFAKSMENYGFMLYKGEGIEENKELSFKYFKQAAEEGQVNSIYQTALMLERGEGVEKNEQESIKYYKKAADQGSEMAIFNLSLMLNRGEEIGVDNKQLQMYQQIAKKHEGIKQKKYLNMFFDPQNFERQNNIIKFRISKVFEVIDKQTGQYYTMKKSKFQISNYSSDKIADYCAEIRITSSINHPSILKFYGFCPVDFKGKPKPMILSEGAMKGSLATVLERESNNEIIKGWNDTKKLIILFGIASAMSYLHSYNIIHRDLSVSSILLDESYYPKLTGFHYSKVNIQNQMINASKVKGEMHYQSPEVLQNIKYSKASDVYSFALVAYKIIVGEDMFFKIESMGVLIRIVCKEEERPSFTQPITDSYRKLIERCWCQNPDERPTFSQIVEELKNNEQFITEKINRQEYQQYIELIEKEPKSFRWNKGVKQLKEFLRSKRHQFHKKDIDLSLRAPINSSIPFNIKNYKFFFTYENQSLNREIGIEEKETEEIRVFTAKISINKIHQFFRYQILNFCREINIISQLNHPAIVKFVGYSSVDLQDRLYPTIVTENYIPYRNLEWIIYQDDKEFQTSQGWNDTLKLISIYGVASAMSYLHSHGIIHRDIKPENISLDEKMLPKLNGFVISKEIQGNQECKSNHLKGTPAYLAPEVLKENKFSKSSDVYSFAMVIYEIMTEEKPFAEYKIAKEFYNDVCQKGVRPKFTQPIPLCYQRLIEQCWSEDPQSRPTFDAIVTELKNNREFLLDSIDVGDYYEYISFIEEFSTTFDPTKRIQHFDEIISTKLNTFHDFDIDMGLKNLYATEPRDLSFDSKYFNLENFEKQDKVDDICFYSVSLIKNKETNEIFSARCTKNCATEFYRHEIINFIQELNIILQLNHPSILKLIGYNPYNFNGSLKPVIVTEYAVKGQLSDIIMKEKPYQISRGWNDTKKLINIYGIASAMFYLHSHNIIHRDLKPENIYLDQFYYPKLSGFLISIENSTNLKENETQIKGTPAYLSPEIMNGGKYSKSSDVYSFALVIYQIITDNKIFEEFISPKEIKHEICDNSNRPKIPDSIPKCYRQLIEQCWSQNPEERPTFERIVSELQTNREFLTESVDENEYFKYIEFIDKSPITFDNHKKIKDLPDIVQARKHIFPKYTVETDFIDIYQTETNNVYFDCNVVHIEKYEKVKVISKDEFSITYEVVDKETGITHLAKKFKTKGGMFRKELNVCSKMNHSSILKYVGVSPVSFKNNPNPIIFYENASNGSLFRLLDLANKNEEIQEYNDTKKLIILYGISSGMSYLHSLNIVHCKLHPLTILLDDYLFPKIIAFDESKKINEKIFLEQFNYIAKRGCYNECDAPEITEAEYCNSSRDVYSFGMIAYRILTNESPFPDQNGSIFTDIYNIVSQGNRPKFNVPIADCYRKLIEKCWAQDPNERPTFDEISSHLRNNKEFITEAINQEEYYNYIKYVEKAQRKNHQIDILDNFIESQNITFRPVKINFLEMKKKPLIHFSIDMGSVDLDKYRKQKKIGSGAFGNVYKAINIETEEICAAKVSKYELDQCSEDMIRNLSREVDIISRLKHPSILKFIGYSPNDFKNNPKPVILTEYVTGGSLDDIIELERKSYSHPEWNDTKKLINIYGIAKGMSYLHKNHFLHRDLKPANILLDEKMYPKIADFGLSKEVPQKEEKEDDEKPEISSGMKGTYAYCPPEIIFDQEYNYLGDVYSYGMLVYEIMTNEIPFEGCNYFQLIAKLRQNDITKFKYPIPYCYRHLIMKCLSKEKYKRPDFCQIVHTLETDKDFITKNVDEDEYLNYIAYIKQIEQNNQMNEKYTTNESPDINQNEENYQEKENTTNEPPDMKQNVERSDTDNEQPAVKVIEEDADLINEHFLAIDSFERELIISKNAISKVYIFKDQRDGADYIGQISMIKIKNLTNDMITNLNRQIDILSSLHHPSLLNFVGFSPVDFKNERKPVVVCEFAPNGTLSHVLELERTGQNLDEWNETKKMVVIYGIASGLSYLHRHGIVHRCLEPDNVFLDAILCPKVGHFGVVSQFFELDQLSRQSTTGIGNVSVYSPPEVIERSEYSEAGDVYAFALIACEMLTCEKAFGGMKQSEIVQDVVMKEARPRMGKCVKPRIRGLIEKCWAQNAEERPTFDEIVDFLRNDAQLVNMIPNNEDYMRYIKFIDDEQKEVFK